MATYTSSTPVKRGTVETIWLVVVSFVAASALVLALVAMQRDGISGGSGSSVGIGQTHGVVVQPAAGDASLPPKVVTTANGICARCAP